MSWLPLRVQSNYSLLYGTCHIAELVAAAARQGYRAMALTDINNVYGVHTFVECCREAGIRSIIGTELRSGDDCAVVLACNRQGFSRITAMLTRLHREPGTPLATLLPRHTEDIVILSDSPDLLSGLAGQGLPLYAALKAPQYRLVVLAQKLDIPLVVVPPVMLLEPEDRAIYRVLRAMANNSTLGQLSDDDATATLMTAMPSLADIRRRFELYPEAIDAAAGIADRCNFSDIMDGWVFPEPLGLKGRNPASELRHRAFAGAEARYGELSDTVVDRLEYELGIIEEKNFSSYFLVVENIAARASRICGRGSGAASLVAYSLNITNVDPIRHNLYFERFLNPERSDPPDIDIDFAWDERDAIIDGVMEAHGRDHCAMVCNHIHFKPRSALRECARVFGMPEGEITDVVNRLRVLVREHREGASYHPDIFKYSGDLPLEEPWPEILRIARRITGFPRHLGVHSGGIIITPNPIDAYAAIETAPKGVPIVCWEKDGTEEAGLVKIDLLGNRSLGVVRDALAHLAATGRGIDEQRWNPIDDKATRAMLARGDTMGVFYLESPATRQLQKKAGVGDFEHIVIHSSIIRPAANDFINEYVDRLHGKAFEPLHPLLEDLLSETYGIMVYQEDVSKTAVALAGFSAGEADGLRRVLSKKNWELKLGPYREQFFAGARVRGVEDHTIEAIWKMIMSFDGYSFCKPHSASYAMVSFQSAWLRAHHPAVFFASVISNGGGFYTAGAYVSEARRCGVEILPPDVNYSQWHYEEQDGAIRVGLMAIAGLMEHTAERILHQRKQGPYRSMEEFMQRVQPVAADMEALIATGACDAIAAGRSRPQMLWAALARERQREHDRAHDGDLFAAAAPRCDAPPLGSPKAVDLLWQEFKYLGFLCSRHPLMLFAPRLARHRVIAARDIPRYQGRTVSVIGWPVTAKTVPTHKNDPMQFWSFEDETAIYETVLFPEAYKRYHSSIDRQVPYIVTGKVENDHGAISLSVQRVVKV